ncbi:hypothetical protein HNR16_001474 [Pseudoclavibacter chungangensis]|nr:hypothetical protein [Pseudoclavibacter chungangensis]NYJ66686.1 hypothetical protein [Pseudoclavibacter chungangensis]
MSATHLLSIMDDDRTETLRDPAAHREQGGGRSHAAATRGGAGLDD